MSIDVKIPSVGESISEVTLASWVVSDGDVVNEGDILCEIESDKATVELPAESSGKIKIVVEAGTELGIGDKIAELDTSVAPDSGAKSDKSESESSAKNASPSTSSTESSGGDKNYPSPAARKILDEKGVDASSVSGSGKDGRITKGDALAAKAPAKESSSKTTESAPKLPAGERAQNREKMTRLRKTIAKRLVEAKNTTAMLTTFNEVDMFELMALRKKYKDAFSEKHGVGLGFMSLFTKACTLALKEWPNINAQIDGEEIVSHNYCDIGIAVSTPKGLVVPVVRSAETLSLAEIEKEIKRLALKGRDGKLTMDEMEGGTFTITNGGVFGSMLSTPIINIPQSAILGMHNIVERPVAYKGQVVIHPVMYLALSYDHRIIDGRESVSFLKMVKDLLEDPARMLLDI